jgi:hypothetical protein
MTPIVRTRLPSVAQIVFAALLLVTGMGWPARAHAAFSWQFTEVYSNADGSVQYIVLSEVSGQNGQNALTGLPLVSTQTFADGSMVTKTFTFDHDLPSVNTANKKILLATPGYAALRVIVPPLAAPRALAPPDYIIPSRFVSIVNGMLAFPTVGESVAWASIPIDGSNAAFIGVVAPVPNVATNFAGQSDSVPRLPVGVVEYYNIALDHYFISPLAPDIDALDSGRIAGWTRTGYTFEANPPNGVMFPEPPPNSPVPVCRYLIPPQHGDSHFFSASAVECQQVADKILVDPNYSGYILETSDAFEISLPDLVTGACAAGTVPVFRLWNHRADSNHRYVTDPGVRSMMISRGYVPEGYGPLGVAMCSPAALLSDARVEVSAPSPYAANCDGVVPPPGTFLYVNGEVEPMLSVDPTNGNHLIGVWQQDRWFNGGARGLRTGVSFDGGRSWSLTQAAFSRCSGGTPANGADFARASDPWVTMAADGTAYQIAIAFNGGVLAPGSNGAVLVSRSSDGGLTWGNPVTLIADGTAAFNDKESLTADRNDAAFVYATWDRITTANSGPTWFSRTVNGGTSWEAARQIYDPGGPGTQTINNQIVSLPSGALALFFSEFAGTRTSVRVLRSQDKGTTWSAPTEIAQTFSVGTHNPATGGGVRDGGNLGAIAAGSNGQLAAVWQDSRFSAGVRDGVAFSRSLDGGVTWSAPVRVNAVASAQGFLPTVTIRDDGTFGVLYYDDRNNTPGFTFFIDIWLAESTDGITWTERHVSGPFDLSRAPIATDDEGSGFFIGDYQALMSAGTTFLPFYVQTNTQNDPNNLTDVFSSILTAAGPASAIAKSTYRAEGAPAPTMTPELAGRLAKNVAHTLARRKIGPLP